jgi:peptide deformylase
MIAATSILISPPPTMAADFTSLQNYVYTNEWKGTGLDLLSYQEAAEIVTDYTMGKWPDPILRRPASAIKFNTNIETSAVQSIAHALRRTARINKAVGLAAQQCAIDVSMIFLDDPEVLGKEKKKMPMINEGGRFLVNPRIVARSSEFDMQVWNEECLVLPPTFRATVLRDAAVTVEYETLLGITQTIDLEGELARCLQHELDHDRGILITDHVGFNELESETMRNIEREGHEQRQALAYARFVSESSSPSATCSTTRTLFSDWRVPFVPNANAADDSPFRQGVVPATSVPSPLSSNPTTAAGNNSSSCDESCLQERKRIIQERRAMMNQSRSNTKRSDVFELSKQRAALYGTQYQGASCPPGGVPCI